jgi:NADH:ubiquinone oxidoreductase subunit 6 (subunit J)
MDSLHAIGFYVSAGLSVAGGLAVAFLPGRGRRAVAVAIAGVGVAGIYTSLSAGFAGVVVLVSFAGCAVLLAGPAYRALEPAVNGRWRQIGAVAAAAFFVALAYAAFRGHFAEAWTGYAPLTDKAAFVGDGFGATQVGRLLFTHDALSADAVGALVLVALVGATAVWRGRERRP